MRFSGASVAALRRECACVLLALGAVSAQASAAGEAHILYAEPVREIGADRATVLRKSGGAPLRELRFRAFERRFHFELDANPALADQLQKSGSSLKLYRGRLTDQAGSWLRLAVKGASIQGMFSDGVDIFVLEPASQVRGALVAPLDAASGDTLIFKLADVRVDAGEATCGLAETNDAQTGAEEFKALVRELKSAPLVMEGLGANVRLQLSALGDASFLQRFGGEQQAREAILIRLNNVDGVFSSQLGVEIQVPSVFVNEAGSDPLSDETDANDLLNELSMLRQSSTGLNSAGLTHLFTGRDLSGETVGIAYLAKLCHARYGVGLTEVRTFNAWRDTLIAAHEIGHNFGANHDGDSQGACPATPANTYLMASSVSGNDRFSQCSIDTMRPRVQAASCIAALPDADLAIPADLGETRAALGRSFEWRLNVANIGGVTAGRARAEILVPPSIVIEDAWVVGGSCTSGAGLIFCQLGDVPGGATRAVNLTLRGDDLGSNSVSARIAADNEASATNNAGDGSLLIASETDLGVTLQGPATATAGSEMSLAFTTTNHSAIEAADVTITVELPAGAAFARASSGAGVCSPIANGVRCSLSSIAGGAGASGSLTLNAVTSGTVTVRARVAGAYVDPQAANDVAEHTVAISPVTTVVAQASTDNANRGGGGAAGPWILIALAMLGVLRPNPSFARRRSPLGFQDGSPPPRG